MMDMADLAPDLGGRLDLPQDPAFQHFHSAAQVTGRKTEANKTLSSSDHQTKLLEAAHGFCETQEYIDLYIQCEDGLIPAHQMVLAVASPFLKQLFQALQAGKTGPEPVCLVLPEVKAGLVQALLHFIYTGNVVTQEGQWYSLMKLVYALNINASIEAESTKSLPTIFRTAVTTSSETRDRQCECGGGKRRKTDQENNLVNSVSLNKDQPGSGLIVNSFTASGVVVKEEPEEKPNFLTEMMDKQSFGLEAKNFQFGDTKSGLNLVANNGAGSTNQANNNQLGHFVSVNPGYQIKMELPPQTSSPSPAPNSAISCPTMGTTTRTSPAAPSTRTPDNNNPDDPLAAIMNQTIFGGDSMNTMFLQVSGNSFPPGLPQGQGQPKKLLDPPSGQDIVTIVTDNGEHNPEEAACNPDDDDLNTEYNCDTCNRAIKGKVMMQAHKFQEHHENAEFESGAFPQDKFACRVCLKLFTRNSDVKAHILRVHCGDRRYPCTTCGKRFKESTHLRKHLYTHTGERPHFCTLCAKGFQTSSDLKRHRKTRVHQEKVEQGGSGDPTIGQTNIEFNGWTEPEPEVDKDLDSGVVGQVQLNGQTQLTGQNQFVTDPSGQVVFGQDQTSYPTTSTTFSSQANMWSTMSGMMVAANSQEVPHVSACTLPSTTLDITDIKWDLLEQDSLHQESLQQDGLQQDSLVQIKRSGSMDSPREETLSIQESME